MKNKNFLIWTVSLLALLGVTACNTVEGAGRDIEAGGEAMKESAEENRNY